MDEQSENKIKREVFQLRLTVSRLHALSISNTQSMMNIISALAEDPGLTIALRTKALDEFKSFQNQIDILTELNAMVEPDDGR